MSKSRRGGFRLPPVRVLLTGTAFGAALGLLNGIFVAGFAFASFGGPIGMIVGAALGLFASAVALLATSLYRLAIGRTRRGIVITSALASTLTTVAVLMVFLDWPGIAAYVWWVILHAVVVFAATAFQAHRLATPTVTVPQRHPSHPNALTSGAVV